MVLIVTLGQQYNVGEEPTVILHTYINRHAGRPDHLCVDGMDGENIPDEEISAAVTFGASVIEHWPTVSGIAVIWSG